MKKVFFLSLTLLLCCAFQSCSKDDDQAQTTIAVTAVIINEAEPFTMTVGETHTFLATVSPTNATDKSITWSSSAPSILFINDQSGVAEALAEGTATITATAGEESATIDVTVTDVEALTIDVESVTISPESVDTLAPEEQVQLTATVTPDDATDKSVTWESLHPTIASVDESGMVTAIAEGKATIRATAGEVSDEIEITVEQPSTPVVTAPAGWTVNGNTATYGQTLGTGWELTVNFENGVCATAQFTTLTRESRLTDIEAVFPESVLETYTITGRGTVATIDLLVVAGCKEYFENLSMAEMFTAFGDNTSAILDNWTASFSVTNLVVGKWSMPAINVLQHQYISKNKPSPLRGSLVRVTYDDVSGEPSQTIWEREYDSQEDLENDLIFIRNRDIATKIGKYIQFEQPNTPHFIINVTEFYPIQAAYSKEDILQQDADAILYDIAKSNINP